MIATARVLVLLTVLLPLAAAVLAPLFGRAARRFALWVVVFHLGVTAGAVVLASQLSAERAAQEGEAGRAGEVVRFRPEFVPGDPEAAGAGGGRTAWTLLSLGAIPTPAGRPAPDIQFFVGLDGLNAWLVALASFMMLPAVLVSWGSVNERRGAFYGWLFLLQAGAVGAFLSFDVILFYVFFEITLVPAFFLIGRWGVGSGRRDAARKFFLYTLAGSLLSLVGLIGVVLTNPTPINPQSGRPETSSAVSVVPDPDAPPGGRTTALTLARPGPITFSLPDLMANVQMWANVRRTAGTIVRDAEEYLTRVQADPRATPAAVREAERWAAGARRVQAEAGQSRFGRADVQAWLFFALIAGFLVKVPVWPFHTWAPGAYGEAPTGVAVLLSALLAKLGTFGLLRLVLPLTPDAAITYGLPVIGVLAAFGIVYAALCAFAQKDLKLVIAYSSVSHLGFLVLALFAFNTEGLSGAVLHMVNHGLSTGALFALTGFLLDRYRTTQMAPYGGLMGRFPNFALLFFVLALASIGLPGLNNFVSEMLMLAGLFDARNPGAPGLGFAVVAVVGILLGAWYMLTAMRRVFFNPLREPEPAQPGKTPADLNNRELVAFGSLAALCLVLGLYPQPVLDSIRPEAGRLALIGESARNRVRGVEDPRPPAAQESLLPGNPIPAGGKAAGKGGPKGKAAPGKGGGPKGKELIGDEGGE
jgi:NADH-quinone oxidoreductase subunit M